MLLASFNSRANLPKLKMERSLKVQNSNYQLICIIRKLLILKISGIGTGSTKKVAEHAACQQVLDFMKAHDKSQELSNISERFPQLRTSPMPPVVVSDPVTLSPV